MRDVRKRSLFVLAPLLLALSGPLSAAVVITPAPASQTHTLSEAGGSSSVIVTLDSAPTADVTLTFTSNDPTEVEVAPRTLLFTPADWNGYRFVTLTGVDDQSVDGNIAATVSVTVSSADPAYDGAAIGDIQTLTNDDDCICVIVTGAGIHEEVITGENGHSDRFTIALDADPGQTVTINLTSNDTTEATLTPATLTFDSTNFRIPQTVVVTGVDDALEDGNQVFYINTGSAISPGGPYDGVNITNIVGINIDDEVQFERKRIDGTMANGQFGRAIAAAGDFNGDGRPDIAIGAPMESNGERNEGRVHLYYNDGSGLAATPGWSAESDAANAYFGGALAAGDFNGDGYDDLLVGAYRFNTALAGAGKVFLYLGSATGLAATASWSAEGTQAGARFGLSVASAGDVNNDGFDDLLIGAPGYAPDATTPDVGRAYLYLGSASGPAATPDWTGEGEGQRSSYGDALSGAGDIDGDGYDDFLIAASKHDVPAMDAGKVYLFRGGPTATIATLAPSQTFTGGTATDYLGSAVAAAGDLNGDGFGDVIISAHLATSSNFGPLWDSGMLYVHYGSATGLAATADWSFPGTGSDEYAQSRAKLGYSVAGVGDVNGDGFADIVAGATHYDHDETDEGWLFLFLGSAAGLAPYPHTFEVDQAQALLGISTSGAGDIDGDGIDDFIAGASLHDNSSGTNAGAAFLYLSARPGIVVTPTAGLQTSETGGSASFSVTLATPPGADVTIPVTSSNPAEGSPSTASLLFTAADWNLPQTVTVTGVDDADVDGDIAYTIELAPAISTDPDYDGRDASDVTLVNLDDELPQVSLSTSDALAWETGPDGGAFVVQRAGSTASSLTVAYTLSGSATNGGDYQALPGSITLPAGSSEAVIAVTPIDDAIAESSESVTLTLQGGATYTLGTTTSGTVVIDDDDTPGVRIAPTGGLTTTEAGGSATFEVVLTSAPTADVTVTLATSDATEGRLLLSELLFTPTDWNTPQEVVVVGEDDGTTDGDIGYFIVTGALSADPLYSGIAVDDVQLTNRDDEPLQNVTIHVATSRLAEPATGETATTTRFIVRRAGSTAAPLTVHYSTGGSATPGQDYEAPGGSVTIAAGSASTGIEIVPLPDDALEGDETIVLTLLPDGAYVIDDPGADTLILADDDQPTPPVANFGIDQTVAEGGSFTLQVVLDRPADTAVVVPYTVSGSATNPDDHAIFDGSLTIAAGSDRASATFLVKSDAVSDDGETILFTMGGMTNAVTGPRKLHTVTIRETNLAPAVTLVARQPGDPTRLVVTTLGEVRVDAVVDDSNPADTHSYDWSLTDNALVDLSGSATDATFLFDPAGLTPGFYNLHVRVTDSGTPPLTTEGELLLEVVASAPTLGSGDSDGDGISDALESYDDSDGDGIPDYLDPDDQPQDQLPTATGMPGSYLMRTEPGLQLRLGDIAFAAGADGAQVEQSDIAAYGDDQGGAGLNPQDSLPNVGGYFDFEIHGLPRPGASVSVVIPVLDPIPAGAVYRKYDPLSGWRDFVTDANNTIASAPGQPGRCPPPSDPAYGNGLTPGHHCIRLTIEDGGPNDNDGSANSVIEDPGTLAIAPEGAAEESGALPRLGGGAIHWGVLVALAWLAGRARSARKGKGETCWKRGERHGAPWRK